MKKILFLLILLGLLSGRAQANNIVFISQNGAGDQSGLTDCTHAKPVAYFNNPLNWVGAPTGVQIGPGTAAHACGVITTAVLFQGSGTPSNPVTLLFEPNADIQAPVCSFNTGCVNLSGRANITLDSVDPTRPGIIENTANGFGLANATFTKGILMSGCTNCVVQHLVVRKMYVQVPPNVLTVDQNQINAIDIGGATKLERRSTISIFGQISSFELMTGAVCFCS